MKGSIEKIEWISKKYGKRCRYRINWYDTKTKGYIKISKDFMKGGVIDSEERAKNSVYYAGRR